MSLLSSFSRPPKNPETRKKKLLIVPLRVKAKTQELDSELLGDRLDLIQVAVDLGAGLVQGVHGGTGQLELPPGLQGDALAVESRADDLPGFDDRFPPEPGTELGEQGGDGLVLEALARIDVVGELLVLGAESACFFFGGGGRLGLRFFFSTTTTATFVIAAINSFSTT